jgi:invasion protein IalB
MTQAHWPLARVLGCALFLVSTGTAGAQQSPFPPIPGAPAAAAPQQTAATYEDWIVRCETRQGPPVQKACEMVQFTQLKGHEGVLTQIAIAQPAKGQPHRVAIQVPISMWLPTGAKLALNDKDEGILAEFKWCVPTSCFAITEVKDDVIKKWRTASEAGKLMFKDGGQRDIALPVSFKGFGTAYDALAKQ